MFLKNTLRRLCGLLLIAILVVGIAPGSLVTPAKAASIKAGETYYLKSKAKLYKSANTRSKVLSSIPKGGTVEAISAKGKWVKAAFGDNRVGFVKKTLLSVTAPAQSGTSTAYVKSATNLYKASKTSSKKLKKLAKGVEVQVLKKSSSWSKVTADGTTGYVQNKKLSKTRPAVSAPSDQKYETLRPGDKGDEVKKLQTRLKALGWFNGSIGGNYLELTKQAVTDFQEAAGIGQTGIADDITQSVLYSNSAPRFVITGVSTANPASGKVYEMDWWKSDISSIFKRGGTAVVTDVRTGISFKVWRGGGTNHADVQPVSAKDTAAMKKAYGGSWSWDRRAIWVSVGGKRYAASMNGMPHGGGSISGNNFDGHFCIHFTNSRTHGTNIICPLHQAAIQMALAAG